MGGRGRDWANRLDCILCASTEPGTSAWVVARLAPGISLREAGARLDSIAMSLQRESPRTNIGRSFSLLRLREEQWADAAPLLVMFQSLVLRKKHHGSRTALSSNHIRGAASRGGHPF